MYKIKGQDQKEYGPVDAAQVRQWISQGRADAQTLAQLEGTTDWRADRWRLCGIRRGQFTAAAAAASRHSPPPDNTIATIIPYRNAPALIAYYLGIFSLIPCVGFVLGIAAFILGIIGLRRARQYPEAKGKVHAWIGIILGGIVALLHVAVGVICIVASSRKR